MATLRSYIFIDQLQPKTMCYFGTFVRGFLPRTNMAALIIEVAPGLEIENITDIAVKAVDVKPGLLVVERQYGYLEIHSKSTASVKAAGEEVLGYLGASQADAMKPEILSSRIVKRVDNYHAFLVNRNKSGSMILAGESLFVLEMQPAAYAILAANEAEKAAEVKVVDYRMMGATGRVYLSGEESDIRAAARAAEQALQARQ
ncbi:BMC domain-containing protein [Kaustia mangrovi]|uniref:BMC domain-containing protein n=1 Tax=Kaustia mangrovi TaxID=2593653 RepID=A0A7S8C345_9HYPH|nr:BMC domain-containing protein [Kaustia mangrovi]QPC42501.1 BMC domain-containing protein [Kaustia mangrovi]